MTARDYGYDELVRRTLHSIADPIEPVGDGLARIRERLREPWHRRQLTLLRAECSDLGWLIYVRCEPLLGRMRFRLANWRADLAPVLRWLGTLLALLSGWLAQVRPGQPAQRPGYHPSSGAAGGPGQAPVTAVLRAVSWLPGGQRAAAHGSATAWLRASVAVAGAVGIVVAGVYALGPLQRTIYGTSSETSSGAPGASGSHNGAGGGGGGVVPGVSGTGTSTGGSLGPGSGKQARAAQRAPAPTSCPSASPAPSASVTSSPPASPSTTPTSPTPTPTVPTDTTSPTPTDLTTPGPAGTTSPGPSAEPVASSAGRNAGNIVVTSGSCATPTPKVSATTSNTAG